MAPQPTRTPIDQSIIDRVSGAVRSAWSGAIKGASDAWFGPLQPIAPQAPEDVRGRQYDYLTGHNLQWRPKGETNQAGVDFQTLRCLADPSLGGLDMLRLVIETRKDTMAAQQWTIKPRVDTDAGRKEAETITKAIRKPDGIHTFRVWQRMLLEDLFVLDQPVVYLAPRAKGNRIMEVMDGATIKRLIRPDGRQPLAPEPAYQQTLKGIPAVDYDSDELIVGARNLRPDRIYGYGPVEQVVTTVNIALRRQVSQLEYYTAGSIPDMLCSVPKEWSAEQVRQFQLYWDSILSGNTEERRRARFVPGDVKPYETKAALLKDGFDDWLARIICFAFSYSPQALIQQMNRATAETAKEAAQEEGLEPIKVWFADYVDEIIEHAFPNGADFQFAYLDEEIPNPEIKARVFSTALAGKPWVTQDEVRERYGLQPLTPEQKAELAPPPQPEQLMLPMGDEAPQPQQAATKAARLAGLAKATRRSLPRHQPQPCDCEAHRQGNRKRYP